jgi:shikimate kinase
MKLPENEMPASQEAHLSQNETPAQSPLPRALRRLILTGFMGAGKSTTGRLLASELGWEFLDLDTHLENRTGATIPELFSRHGEAHFRRLESTALASALGRSNVVLALGGGTPEDLTNRLLIEQTPGTLAVFLDAPFDVLFDRCLLQQIDRPVLADTAAAQLRFERRRPLYHRLSRIVVDTSSITAGETVQAILSQLKRGA